jgi:hypothetical protein
MAGGRPTDFTPELGAQLCFRIMTYKPPGNSLTRICEAEDMPCRTTVYYWILDAAGKDATEEQREFLNRYRVAHEIKHEKMYDEITHISYDITNDIIVSEKGTVGNSTNVARARLITDNLKWCLGKMHPERYGDKSTVEHTGSVELTLLEQIIDDEKKKPDLEKEKEKIKARRKK